MSKDKHAKKKAKEAKKADRDRRRETRMRGDKGFDLTALPAEAIHTLVPRKQIEAIIGKPINWTVMRGQHEILQWSTPKYNHIVTSDVHMRCRHVPKERHPLHTYFSSHVDEPDFAAKVGYIHNQVVVEGTLGDVVVATIHLGTVFPDALHLGYIELANPNIRAEKPIDKVQVFAGLGNGVLNEILARLRAFASQHGFARITGFAVDMLRAKIFCRRGFSLDSGGYMLDTAIRHNHQIPIVMQIEPVPSLEPGDSKETMAAE